MAEKEGSLSFQTDARSQMLPASTPETAMTDTPFRIVFAIYDGVTHLDFTGPHQFLSRLPNSETVVASCDGGTVHADGVPAPVSF